MCFVHPELLVLFTFCTQRLHLPYSKFLIHIAYLRLLLQSLLQYSDKERNI